MSHLQLDTQDAFLSPPGEREKTFFFSLWHTYFFPPVVLLCVCIYNPTWYLKSQHFYWDFGNYLWKRDHNRWWGDALSIGVCAFFRVNIFWIGIGIGRGLTRFIESVAVEGRKSKRDVVFEEAERDYDTLVWQYNSLWNAAPKKKKKRLLIFLSTVVTKTNCIF